jgi:hypothetical protein
MTVCRDRHARFARAGEDIFGQDVVEQIINETGCYPFLVQAICSEVALSGMG